MGKPKYIESPEKFWELFVGYKEYIINNPILVQDFVGKDGDEVYRKKPKPLTMEGFECYVMEHTDITYPDLTHYFENKDGRYEDYVPISSRIKKEIRTHQIEGGMAQVFNHSLTARINGLVEKTETKNTHEVEIFKGINLDVSENNSTE